MLTDSNTVFMLEVLLQPHVYGRPLELKRTQPLHDAVLSLLESSSTTDRQRRSGCAMIL